MYDIVCLTVYPRPSGSVGVGVRVGGVGVRVGGVGVGVGHALDSSV